MSGHRNLPPADTPGLSDTERAVLELLGRGMTKAEIALCLNRTLGTIARAISLSRLKAKDADNRKAISRMSGAGAPNAPLSRPLSGSSRRW